MCIRDRAKWSFENRVAECEKMTKGVYPQNVIDKILNYQEYESIREMLLNHLHERRYNKPVSYTHLHGVFADLVQYYIN